MALRGGQAHLDDQHAYESILSSASTCFSPAANRSPPTPCPRAPESDPSSFFAIPEDPPQSTSALPSSDEVDDPLGPVPHVTHDYFFGRRQRRPRDLPRIFTRPRQLPTRHGTALQPWPPRRDSLMNATSGVR